MKALLREVFWSYFLSPLAAWIYLTMMTLVFALDVFLGDNLFAQTFGVSNLIIAAVLAVGWWIIWLAVMVRRRNGPPDGPSQHPDWDRPD